MRALAERIDYSPASLYRYYGSKGQVIQAVCEQGHRLLRDRITQVDTTLDVVEYLVQFGLVCVHFAMRIAHDSRFPVDYTTTEPAILQVWLAPD